MSTVINRGARLKYKGSGRAILEGILYTIKTKPITSHRVDIYTLSELRRWFKDEYRLVLKYTKINKARYIYNMDEKGTRLACPAGQEIVVLVGITEMYVGIPKNRISITVIKYICANRTAIPPVIIAPGTMIMGGWFHKKITGHEVITVSDTGYTNEGICMAWLDHFIKQYNCSPTSH
jgi:hypothetical protein